ncbi:MAG: hypothetical protein IJ837_04095 [Clostridia bacterium]|nr:hypothetical protein [Clostridia bacterium]
MENINYDEVFEKIKPYIKNIKNISSENIKPKLEFYQKELDLNQDDLTLFFLRYPLNLVFSINSNSPTSAKTKLEVFDMLGVSRQKIVEHPFLLNFPAMRLRFRYMLTSRFFDDEQVFNSSILSTSEDAIYARYQYFRYKFKNVSDYAIDLVAPEKRFQKIYGTDTKSLIEKYPITEEVVEEVEREYNSRCKTDKTHKQITLTELEKEAIINR